MDTSSTAFHIGQIAGAVLGIAIVVGWFVFFVIALIKAIRTSHKGWIIAACILGLPSVAVLGVFLYGMSQGFVHG